MKPMDVDKFKDKKVFVGAAAAGAIVQLALLAGVCYVAIHFINKYW